MTKRLQPLLKRSEFLDAESYYKALHYAGGPQTVGAWDESNAHGYFGNLIRASQGKSSSHAVSDADYSMQLEQKSRQNVFIRKLFARRRSVVGNFPSEKSTFIGALEYAAHYAAAEFAYEFDLYCEVSITFWWRRLGADTDREVKDLFSRFVKCLNDWLFEREIPTAYFYCHENSQKIGTHTHFAVYIPPFVGFVNWRKEFRRWVMDWGKKESSFQCRAIRVSAPFRGNPLLHWNNFHYQMKGYDPSVVVQSARNADDGREVRLEHLIARQWSDPGLVTLKPRIGSALNLGSSRRKLGIPEGLEELRSIARAKSAEERKNLVSNDSICPPIQQKPNHARPEFHSRYEDGSRDVRRLYPIVFCRWVTTLSYDYRKIDHGHFDPELFIEPI